MTTDEELRKLLKDERELMSTKDRLEMELRDVKSRLELVSERVYELVDQSRRERAQ